MNIFTNLGKFINVKSVILMIEISIVTQKYINSFMQLFFWWIRKQGLDKSIQLLPMISIWIIEGILPNTRGNIYHQTSRINISIDMFLFFNPQTWYEKQICSE